VSFGGGTWSGGGGGGQGGVWRPPSGGSSSGLPFAGIPPELQERVDKVLEKEPPPREGPVEFSHRPEDDRRFSLRRFIAPHWLALSLGTALVGIEVAAEQAGPLLTQIAIDRGMVPRRMRVVAVVAGIYLLSILLNMGVRTVRTAWTGRVGEKLLYELRIRVFSHLQRLSLDFYSREKAGVVMTRMTSDIDALQQLLQDGLINLVVQGITLIFVSGVLIALNVRLALVVIFGVVPIMVGATLWFRSASDRAFLAVRERIADVLGDLAESLAGIRIAAMYNRQRHNAVKHRNVVGHHYDANVKAAKISSGYSSGVEGIGVGAQVLILLVGGSMVLRGTLTPGELAAFFLYLTTFFAPIQQLVQLYNVYQQGRAAVFKLGDLLEESPSVPESGGAYGLPSIDGEIHFDRVTFGYSPDKPVLSDVSIAIAAGEKFALVGPTGAGKSTIAKLIARFYDPLDGRVVIDGHDVKDVTLESLRTQLGVVPQEPFLFHASIRENIAFGRRGATDEEVLEACRAVGIDDLIDRLPRGLDTPCHERGITLSSGERQLIALARAFLNRPRVVILDEATSNLDLGTEAKLERALDVLLEGRTAILIAHRLSTAMRADRIAVIDHGMLVETGHHTELVESGGLYAEMVETWLRHGAEPALAAED
jgi:ATP-binding cassette subfamily B protein